MILAYQNNLGISKQVAKEYIDNYFARYPYVKKYMEDIVEKAKMMVM